MDILNLPRMDHSRTQAGSGDVPSNLSYRKTGAMPT